MLIAINVICKHGRLNGHLSFGEGNVVPGTPVWCFQHQTRICSGFWTSSGRREGTLGLTSNGGFGWVGLMGGWGLPQHMACNCGLLDAEKGGSVMVLRWSYWGALTHFSPLMLNQKQLLFVWPLRSTEDPSRFKAFLFSGCNYLWLDMQNTFVTHPAQCVSLYNLFPFDPFQIQSCVFIFQTHWPQLFGLETGGGGAPCGRTARRRPAQ